MINPNPNCNSLISEPSYSIKRSDLLSGINNYPQYKLLYLNSVQLQIIKHLSFLITFDNKLFKQIES